MKKPNHKIQYNSYSKTTRGPSKLKFPILSVRYEMLKCVSGSFCHVYCTAEKVTSVRCVLNDAVGRGDQPPPKQRSTRTKGQKQHACFSAAI